MSKLKTMNPWILALIAMTIFLFARFEFWLTRGLKWYIQMPLDFITWMVYIDFIYRLWKDDKD